MRHFYFDHNATTPVAPGVLRGFAEALAEIPGNASSIHHFGQAAKQRLERARRQVAGLIGCEPREIVFTSGGTESNNLAIFGVARRRPGCHVITSSIEHPAVLGPCAQLEREGFAVTRLPVGAGGRVDPGDVRRALRPDTALISIMFANNETGAVQPVEEIARIAGEAGVPFHSDAVQAAGRIPVAAADADLLSIGGHKFGAPKGIGALYVRKGIELAAQMHGGHHERDQRAGTENVPGAVALGIAAEGGGWQMLSALRDRLEQGILRTVPDTRVNGDTRWRLPNTSNIGFAGIGGEAMVIALDLRGYAVSSGSACSSGAVEPSHVLLAMGLSADEARSSVRFSIGPSTTAEQVDGLVAAVEESAVHLRRISPFTPARPVLTHAL